MATSTPSGATYRGRILIVEDDQGIATLQANRLKRFGHVVDFAQTAAETFQKLDEITFDLLILDYGLSSEVTGIAIYAVLRERGFFLPAILVTGFDDPKIIIQAMRLGVRDFLPKSVEFLDELPLTVERILHQVAVERSLAESAALREKQEQLQAAFDAAQLAHWYWDIPSGTITWAGHHREMFGSREKGGASSANPEDSYEGFLSLVHPEDRSIVEEGIAEARETREVFEREYRIIHSTGEIRWLLGKGRCKYSPTGEPKLMTGVVVDITERKRTEGKLDTSLEKIQALNDRLQLSISETQHRVKNHLQSIISLINLHLRETGVITTEGAKKVNSHIQGLAALYDVLTEQSREDGDTSCVQIDEVYHKLITVFRREAIGREIVADIGSCRVSAKQGATLSIILNELLSNALKHGSGPITVMLECKGQEGQLRVQNEGSRFPENFDPTTTGHNGLLLLSLLAKTDLAAVPKFENLTEGACQVRISFPIEENIGAMRA